MSVHRNLLARSLGELRQTFRGLHIGTHPDYILATTQVLLSHADEIVLDTGRRVTDWDDLTADITVSGAGGLDTGSEEDALYEVYAIYKPAGGVKNLLLHKAKALTLELNGAAEDGTHLLRSGATTNVKLAQGFKTVNAGTIEMAAAKLIRANTPTGSVWLTIESDSAGVPSGSVLATSDLVTTNSLPTTATVINFPFRTPFTPTPTTQYHLVLQGDYAASATVNIGWRADTTAATYTGGSKAAYNGTSWTADSDDDFTFRIFLSRYDAAVTMPAGYEGKALLTYVNNATDLQGFLARDRRVSYIILMSTLDSGAVATTTPSPLFDPTLPFRVLSPVIGVANSTSGAVVGIGPGTKGWLVDVAPLPFGGVVGVAPNTTVTYPTNFLGEPFVTEYCSMYMAVSAGNGHVWILGYTW